MRRRLPACLGGLLLWAVATMGAQAADFGDAKSLVGAIEKKLDGVRDYSMIFYAQVPAGEWVYDYRCLRPSSIRTQILDGSHRGTVIVSVPTQKPNMVKIQVGTRRMWRSIRKLKLGGTPMVESVLDKFSADLRDYDFSMKAHQRVAVEVGKPIGATVEKNVEDPIFGDDRELHESEPQSGGSNFRHQWITKDCYVLRGQRGNTRVEMAFDTATLWPVSMKRWKGNKLDSDAQIWQMRVNSGVVIDL